MAGVRLPLGVSQAIPWTPGGSNPELIFKKKKKISEVCDPSKCASVCSHCQHCSPYKGSYINTWGEGWRQCCVGSLWAGLQCNKFPYFFFLFFHQWKQAITPYLFTSLMGFSAMLLSVVMEHPLVKIHMASFVTIAANHNWEGWGGGQFPITVLLENLPEFSTLHSFSSWFDVIVGRQQLIFSM